MTAPSESVEIKHTCGHVVKHKAWGKRIAWLATCPCPECAGIPMQHPGLPIHAETEKLVKEVRKAIREPDLSFLPPFVTEHRFHPVRKWKFDYAWPERLVALEIEGSPGVGRHTYPKGFLADMEKYNTAVALGWRVVRAARHSVSLRQAVAVLHNLLTDKPLFKL